MIDIPHEQARFLIRRGMDRELPAEQWDMLQAHLEKCEDCRAYRDQLYQAEKRLRSVFISRWRQVQIPTPWIEREVLAWRKIRNSRLKHYFYSGLGLLALLLIFYLERNHPIHRSLPVTPTFSPSPTPAEAFQGIVAFTANRNGRSQILLASTGTDSQSGEQTNLTQDSSDHIDPTWSPDGDWIAFLSNRSGGWQLYVMSVAGTRLTQLTNDPNIEWRGPISWSYDGIWIALTGQHLHNDRSTWIYLVQASGRSEEPSGTRALSQTRDTPGWARFSPYRPWLAVQLANGGIQVYSLEDGWSGEITESERQWEKMHPAPGGSFDWSYDTFSLVYLSQGPYESSHPDLAQPDAKTEIVASAPIMPFADFAGLSHWRTAMDSLPGVDALRSVSYMPDGRYVASLSNTNGTGCWTVHLVSLFSNKKTSTLDLTGLCVVSNLERANWSPDGKWLVVIARRSNLTTAEPMGDPAIYTIHVPRIPNGKQSLFFEPLANTPSGVESVAVRPSGDPLNIEPIAANPEPYTFAPPPPANLPGQVVYSISVPIPGLSASNSAISLINPDSTDHRYLMGADASHTCPTWSPDHEHIAFLSDRDSPPPKDKPGQSSGENGLQANQVYVMKADGSEVKQLAPMYLRQFNINPADASVVYDCPVWSPNNRMLAVTAHTGSSYFLNFVMWDGFNLRSFAITRTPLTASPVWIPNGQAVLLAEPGNTNRSALISIFAYDSPGGLNRFLDLGAGSSDVQAMAFSPNGQHLAIVVVKYPGKTNRFDVSLVIYQWPLLRKESEVGLTGYYPANLKFPGRLEWTDDQKVFLAIPSSLTSRYNASFFRYDLPENTLSLVARIEGALSGWAIHNGWLVFSAESGLWGMPVLDQYDQRVRPFQLDNEIVSSMDWR